MDLQPAKPTPDRTCGACTLCCKVYIIPSLGKPEGKWCSHCVKSGGCKIYDSRPAECREFFCLWMVDASIPMSWKPDIAKMSMSVHPKTGFIHVQVDPGFPQAWRREPYLSDMKRWAEQLLPNARHLIIFVNSKAILMMPSGPTEIGSMSPDTGFFVRERYTASGKVYEVEKLDPSMPSRPQSLQNLARNS